MPSRAARHTEPESGPADPGTPPPQADERSTPTGGTSRPRIFAWLEVGRRPTFFNLTLTAALAVLSIVRLPLLISTLPASDYGSLNIYITLSNLIPVFLSVGLTLQYQRISREHGQSTVAPLMWRMTQVLVVTTVPVGLATAAIIVPYSNHLAVQASLLTGQALGFTLSVLAASAALGLGWRTVSTGLVFVANATLTLPVVLMVAFSQPSVTFVLAVWCASSIVAGLAAVVYVLRLRARDEVPQAPAGPRRAATAGPSRPSIREGITTIPALLGPWLLVFSTRYALGVHLGTEALAQFALATTVVDMAFLIAASAVTPQANRLMEGTMTSIRATAYASAIFVVLVAVGGVLASLMVQYIARADYEFSWSVMAAYALGGVFRIYSTTARYRMTGLRKMHHASIAYVTVAGAAAILLAATGPSSAVWFALTMAGGYAAVSAWQSFAIRTAQRALLPAR